MQQFRAVSNTSVCEVLAGEGENQERHHKASPAQRELSAKSNAAQKDQLVGRA